MGMNFAVQLINILMLLGLLVTPFALVYWLIQNIRKKKEDNEKLEVRIAVLEKKVRDLEVYIEESE